MRLRVLIIFLAFATLAAICIHKPPQNAGLPIVHTALPTDRYIAEANRLYAPCPLSPRNLPHRGKETA